MTGSFHLATRVRPPLFFSVTYVLSWAVWIPLLLSHWNVGPFHVDEGLSQLIRLLGVIMPGIVAMILTAIVEGRRGLGQLLGRLALWRVGWRWWAAAVLVQPILLVATALLFNAFGGTPAIVPPPGLTIAALIVNCIMLAIAASGEEIGWRGVALPGLQQTQSPLVASAVLGLLWATWHLPFWLLIDTIPLYGAGYLLINYVFVLAGTPYITWFFNHSRGSLLLPVAFHFSFNVVNVALLPVTSSTPAFLIFTLFECLIVAAVLPRLAPRPRAAVALPS